MSVWWLTQDDRVQDWDNGLHTLIAFSLRDQLATGNLTGWFTEFNTYPPLVHLIGAIGVSGDGVDQDDLISASGTAGFQPSTSIRADSFTYLGARLPYANFPRAPELNPPVTPVPSTSGN